MAYSELSDSHPLALRLEEVLFNVRARERCPKAEKGLFPTGKEGWFPLTRNLSSRNKEKREDLKLLLCQGGGKSVFKSKHVSASFLFV